MGAASFHVVTVNPPYMIGEHGIRNANPAKYIARHEALCTLEDVLRESEKLLISKGRFYMVHRPFRLAEILAGMSRHRLEPKRMRLVHPYADKEPNMVLVEGVRGRPPADDGGAAPHRVQGGRQLHGRSAGTVRHGRDRQTGVRYGRNIISVRHPHRESGGHDLPGGARAAGGGSHRGGGHPQQREAAEPF